MLNPDKLNEEVLTDILYNLGYDEDDIGEGDVEDYNQCMKIIETSSVYDAFNRFLEWNGIVGYTLTIIKALDSIRAAEVKTL